MPLTPWTQKKAGRGRRARSEGTGFITRSFCGCVSLLQAFFFTRWEVQQSWNIGRFNKSTLQKPRLRHPATITVKETLLAGSRSRLLLWKKGCYGLERNWHTALTHRWGITCALEKLAALHLSKGFIGKQIDAKHLQSEVCMRDREKTSVFLNLAAFWNISLN